MARKPTRNESDGSDGSDVSDQTKDPLASEAGRAWLNSELERAEHEEANGPGGSGWQHNEALRPAIVERAEFLRGLVGIVNGSAGASPSN